MKLLVQNENYSTTNQIAKHTPGNHRRNKPVTRYSIFLRGASTLPQLPSGGMFYPLTITQTSRNNVKLASVKVSSIHLLRPTKLHRRGGAYVNLTLNLKRNRNIGTAPSPSLDPSHLMTPSANGWVILSYSYPTKKRYLKEIYAPSRTFAIVVTRTKCISVDLFRAVIFR